MTDPDGGPGVTDPDAWREVLRGFACVFGVLAWFAAILLLADVVGNR